MTWGAVDQLAKGREYQLHSKVVEHIKDRNPDATLRVGLGEHLATRHARTDSWSEAHQTGQPDLTVISGLPNGFQEDYQLTLKTPTGKPG